ncbi:hypothetical protein BDA99DRAFT_542331 [Phascolomyces articulosus]|uniref:F-box domain-containing protein n=1 Tax=Phascolomyces articulosus TaxID=60185 RepID=A0AAD5JQT7_9FUNG|nr:hypothetical protein BDA99DRAFT_542331 [Phascolomyces articulosus]
MPKGRDLKNKLKHYSNNNPQQLQQQQQQQQQTRSNSTASVTERLAKLRVEQLRAEKNRQQRQEKNNSNESLTEGTLSSLSSRTIATTTTFSPRVAGPAAPPSWTRRAVVRRAPPAQRPEQPVDSLCSQCAQLATDYVLDHPKSISSLSITTKQQVLNRLGLRLTDRLLTYFCRGDDEHYSQLNFHSAPISFSTLVRCFWKVDPSSSPSHLLTKEDNNNGNDDDDDWIADDWEEQEEKEWDEQQQDYYIRYTYDPSLDWVLEPVLHLLKQPVDQEHVLMTPLSMKLISLDLSFISLPGYAASLIALTLPHLSNLSVAGCFTQDPGLAMIARHMKQLQHWDIGYHGWLDLTVIQPIDWQRDLLHLQWLGVAMCGQDFKAGESIAQHIFQYRRHYHLYINSSFSP